MKRRLSAPSVDALVVQAQQSYQRILAQWGLLDFTRDEMARARASLRSAGQTRIDPEDICYQAAVTRLHSRDDMSAQAVAAALHELLDAEYECDQARWERDCHRVAMMEHSHFKLAVPKVP
ncbi:MAG: hypothetical protein MUP47_06330 [Phycisphaerae bacterium]|nr:hypothetical protein [Phycisphaerae bacterium]